MKTKSEIRIAEARKKAESRKEKSDSFSIQPASRKEGTEVADFGLQSSDFFRISVFGPRISESNSVTQFNSEF